MSKGGFMDVAWGAFIAWAISEPEMRAAFTKATGRHFMPPPKCPLDALIAQATGADKVRETVEAFVRWATEEHWGMEYAPQRYREAMAAA